MKAEEEEEEEEETERWLVPKLDEEIGLALDAINESGIVDELSAMLKYIEVLESRRHQP